MTLLKYIIPYFNKQKNHSCGLTRKNRMPRNFTIHNFGHPVSKSWHRPRCATYHKYRNLRRTMTTCILKYRCNRKFPPPPEDLPPRRGEDFLRKFSPHPENLPPWGVNFPRKPRKFSPPGGTFSRGGRFRGTPGNFPPPLKIFPPGGKIS